jgi:hypothetical protein
MRLHVILAMRPDAKGGTEGQTILVTRRRKGLLGYLINRALFALTVLVGLFFSQGERIFNIMHSI